MGKGEIARYEQFLLFSQCLQKACFPEASEGVIVWEWEAITRRQIFDSYKLKQYADDNFKFDENGRKLSKQVENTVRKGEIAQCFQKACFPEASKGVIVWEWVKTSKTITLKYQEHTLGEGLTLHPTITNFNNLEEDIFWLPAFSPFPAMFSKAFSFTGSFKVRTAW